MRPRVALPIRDLAPALVALGLMAAPPADASSIYGVTVLGSDPASLLLNKAGQVAGPDGATSDFLYGYRQHDKLTPVPLPDDVRTIDGRGPFSFYDGERLSRNTVSADIATAGNHNGVLVGTGSQTPYSNLGDYQSFPVGYLYRPDPVSDKPLYSNQSLEHNSRGGWGNDQTPIPGDPTGQGTMTSLGWKTLPTAINDSNEVAGAWAPVDHGYIYKTTPYHAFTEKFSKDPIYGRLQGSGFKDLGTLGGMNSHANAISNSGQVVGGSDTAGGTYHAFSYADGKMADLGVLPGMTGSVALGLNARGQVVGSSGRTAVASSRFFGINNALALAKGYSDGHAFLFSNGIMEDLNDRLPATSGLTLDRAFAINDAGQILAEGHGADGVEHGLLLSPLPTPAPEPTTLALLGLAAVGFGVRRLKNSRI